MDCPFRWLASKEVEPVKDAIASLLVAKLLPLFASDKQEFIKAVKVSKGQQLWVADYTMVNTKILS